MKKKTLLIAMASLMLCSVATANTELPIEPIDTKVASKASMDAMLETVVSSLPKDKQQSIANHFSPSTNDPAAKQPIVATTTVATTVDEFGRKVLSTNVAQARTADMREENNSKQELSPFERMQRQMAEKFKPEQTYKLKPGANITIPAAKHILNSIRTSFKEVDIRSSDPNVIIKVEGNFVYFTSDHDAPFGLIIYEKGVKDTQVNLTVWPLNVMPAMVDLKVRLSNDLKEKVAIAHANNEKAKQEQEARIRDMQSELELSKTPKISSAPYLEQINQLMSTVAGRGTPRGFTLQTDIPAHALQPCNFGVFAETKQRLISSRQIVDVVLVDNTTDHPVILREDDCWIDDDVISTGILDKATLKPNEKTEVYVLRDRHYQQRILDRNERPSLLD